MAALKIFLCLNLVLLAYRPADGYQRRDFGSRLVRYLMYNPADMSTAIGYKNHTIHNMGSLVNEASSQAHGGAGSSPYNVPNFPAMGNNGGQPGSSSNSASGTSGSGSASFSGTNQWRCDSHVVAQCDTQCLDVDPKDGCPFCIPGCTGAQSAGSASQSGSSSSPGNQPFNSAGTSSQSGSSGGSSGSGSSGGSSGSGSSGGSSGSGLSGAGSPFGSGTPASAPFGGQVSSGLSQSAGTLSGTGSSLQGTAGQNPGTLTGTSGQGSQSTGSLGQLPSGLAGTGSNGQSQGTSGTGSSSGTSCPYYPPNCPKTFTKLENGCLTCTLLQQLNIKPSQALSTSVPTTAAKVTCPPTRCVAPCNKGIVLAADGCPRCKCPAYT